MNEKEALTGLKNLSQIFKLCSENDVKLKDFNIMNPKAYKEAIETILDLYNKEKENTKYWKDRYKNEVENEAILIEHISVLAETMGLEKDAPIDEMIETFNKEKEKYKRLQNTEAFQDCYISKDKIKEKIEELEKRYTEHCYFQYNKKEVLDICINELKELLEE